MEDLYKILEVDRNATPEQLKQNYRRLCKVHHPDKGGDENQFKKINNAYETLSDPAKKQQYDNPGFGGGGFEGFHGFGGGGGDHTDEILRQFGFGGGFGRRQSRRGPSRRQRGEDVICDIHLTLEEVANGATQTITYDKHIRCKSCSGNGSKFGKSIETCSHCGGVGIVNVQQGPFVMQTICNHCSGEGKKITQKCPDCAGNGYVNQKFNSNISVPHGLSEGDKVSANGQGHESNDPGGVPGDLILKAHIKKHKDFQRNGEDIIYKLNASFTNLVFGGKIKVPTLTGHAEFDLPKNSKVGSSYRMNGLGLPVLNQPIERKGDLIIVVDLKIPEKLNQHEEYLLKELAKEENFF